MVQDRDIVTGRPEPSTQVRDSFICLHASVSALLTLVMLAQDACLMLVNGENGARAPVLWWCRRAVCGGMAHLKHAEPVVFRKRELRSTVDWTVR